MRAIAAILAFALATAAVPLDRKGVVITNRCGQELEAVFIAAVASESWEDNVLAPDRLPDGGRLRVLLTGYGDAECSFDVKVRASGDESWVLRGVDLCRTSELTVSPTGISAR